jgi:hypothetical protein
MTRIFSGKPRSQIRSGGLVCLSRYGDFKYYDSPFEVYARHSEFAPIDESTEGAPIQEVDPVNLPERKSTPARSLLRQGCTLARRSWREPLADTANAGRVQRLR